MFLECLKKRKEKKRKAKKKKKKNIKITENPGFETFNIWSPFEMIAKGCSG